MEEYGEPRLCQELHVSRSGPLSRNIVAGTLFCVIGTIALGVGADYPVGTLLDMGPGYFPRLTAGLLVFAGVVLIVTGLLAPRHTASRAVLAGRPEQQAWKPLLAVSAAVLSFALLVERAGFIAAVVALVALSTFAWAGRRRWELPGLVIALTLVAWLVFIEGLRLPFPLWHGTSF